MNYQYIAMVRFNIDDGALSEWLREGAAAFKKSYNGS